jgi:hypothetical protein
LLKKTPMGLKTFYFIIYPNDKGSGHIKFLLNNILKNLNKVS